MVYIWWVKWSIAFPGWLCSSKGARSWNSTSSLSLLHVETQNCFSKYLSPLLSFTPPSSRSLKFSSFSGPYIRRCPGGVSAVKMPVSLCIIPARPLELCSHTATRKSLSFFFSFLNCLPRSPPVSNFLFWPPSRYLMISFRSLHALSSSAVVCLFVRFAAGLYNRDERSERPPGRYN